MEDPVGDESFSHHMHVLLGGSDSIESIFSKSLRLNDDSATLWNSYTRMSASRIIVSTNLDIGEVLLSVKSIQKRDENPVYEQGR